MKLFDYFKTNRELRKELATAEAKLQAKNEEIETLRKDLGEEVLRVVKLREANSVINYNIDKLRDSQEYLKLAIDACRVCHVCSPHEVIDTAKMIEQYYTEKLKEAN